MSVDTRTREIRYKYDDCPTIARFSQSTAFIRGLMGPFGSGKSSGCVIELLKIAAKQRPGPDGIRRSRFAVIRNTYPQLEDTTMQTFFQWLPPSLFGTYKVRDHTFTIDQLDPTLHIEIMFRALDREEHVANLLSLELTGAWVNEAREVPWAIIQALTGRVGRYPSVIMGGCVDPCIIMDTNPPDDESWWYRKFEEERPANWALFKQPGGMDPGAENKSNLPANYYERMIETMDADAIEVYVHGKYGFLREGKPVYPEYNDALHCVTDWKPIPGVTVYRGWDFGLTPACVLSQVLPSGQWVTFDEFVADSVGFDSFATYVLDEYANRWPALEHTEVIDIGDPSGNANSAAAMHQDAPTCFAILRAKGVKIQSGDQSPTIRIGSVKKSLRTLISGKPQLLVDSRCKMLRRGYQGRYEYRKMKISGAQARYHDSPDKNDYSHPHDANQYVAARLFGASLKTAEKTRKRRNHKVLAPKLNVV